ncbi:hypothetical protein KHA80_13195 [Anaerobacillus sp. HL2]|nr:hypothetical protein KHA80_13195 [Anaerobacillus sp. HL2]
MQLGAYVKTLKKKPGALADSTALQQATKKLKTYTKIIIPITQEVLELIELIKDGTAFESNRTNYR